VKKEEEMGKLIVNDIYLIQEYRKRRIEIIRINNNEIRKIPVNKVREKVVNYHRKSRS